MSVQRRFKRKPLTTSDSEGVSDEDVSYSTRSEINIVAAKNVSICSLLHVEWIGGCHVWILSKYNGLRTRFLLVRNGMKGDWKCRFHSHFHLYLFIYFLGLWWWAEIHIFMCLVLLIKILMEIWNPAGSLAPLAVWAPPWWRAESPPGWRDGSPTSATPTHWETNTVPHFFFLS